MTSDQSEETTIKPELDSRSSGSLRIYASVLAILVVALLSQARSVEQIARLAANKSDPDSLVLSDLAQLKESLSSQTTVGYVPGIEKDKFRLGSLARPKLFFLTQYALAPIIVDYSTNHDLVVSYFGSPANFEIADEGLKPIRSLPNGVVLLGREP